MQRWLSLVAIALLALAQFVPAALTCCLSPACMPVVSQDLLHNEASCCSQQQVQVDAIQVDTDNDTERCTFAPLLDLDEFPPHHSEHELPDGNQLFSALVDAFSKSYLDADIHDTAQPLSFVPLDLRSQHALSLKRCTQLLI